VDTCPQERMLAAMKARAIGCIAAAFFPMALWQARASACSVLMPEKQSLSCPAPGGDAGGSATSVAGAELELEAVEIRRSQYAPPGHGDCGELGNLRLRFRLAGSGAWPADVGLLLTLRDGDFHYFQPPLTQLPSASGWLLLPQAGEVRFLGPDDPRQPIRLALEARAVDCNNAVSAPIQVLLSDPGRPLDAGAPRATDVTTSLSAAAGGAGTAPPTDVQASRTTPPQSACALAARAPGLPVAEVNWGSLWLATALLWLRRSRALTGATRHSARWKID
jgi:hypothetical protein